MLARLLLTAALLLTACAPLPAAPGPARSEPARLVVVVWSGTTATIGVLDLTGRFSARLTIDDPAGRGVRAALAPDRHHLAVTVARPGRPPGQDAQLLLADLDRGAVQTLYDGIDSRGRPLWSPDGSEVVVRRASVTAEGATEELLAVNVESGASRELASGINALGLYAVGWNADGAHVLRIAADGSALEVAGNASVPLSAGPVRDVTMSPDGRWFAFSDYSNGATLGLLGPGGLLRLPVPGPFVHPAWRPDGALLVAGTPASAAGVVAVAPVPVLSIGAAPGTVAVPVAVGRNGWVAARAVHLSQTGAVEDAWLELVGPDGQRRPVRLVGWVDPLGWIGD
jgi:Tol biopolymer transport system component